MTALAYGFTIRTTSISWREDDTTRVLAALCLALLAGCGGGGDKTVAEVGGQQVTQQQLDALVQHFRREAQQEGKDFPQEGTSGFVQLRNQLLGLLVYRTELQQAREAAGRHGQRRPR